MTDHSGRANHATQQDTNPFNAAFLEPPNSITIPLWVKASGVSPAAQCLVDPLIAGAMRVHGDQAPTLNRQFLAWWLGASRYDKGLPAPLAELEGIGFLVIYSGKVNEKGRRQARRDQYGRSIPDTYAIRPNPPEGYAGPKNLSEAYELFRNDWDAAVTRHRELRLKSRAVSIPRTQFGRIENPQVSPVPRTGGTGDVSRTPGEGYGPVSAGQPRTPRGGYGRTPREGYGDVSADQARTPRGGYVDREKEEPLRGSSFDRSKEAAPGPASPASASHTPQAWDLVVGLSYPKGQRPTAVDARRLAVLVDSAVMDHGLSLAEVRDYLEHAMTRAKVNPSAYLANALHSDKLPIPGDTPEPGTADDADLSPSGRAWCGGCDRPDYRYLLGDDGDRPCPECHPSAVKKGPRA